jgi:hypothetical protein
VGEGGEAVRDDAGGRPAVEEEDEVGGGFVFVGDEASDEGECDD